MHILLLELFYSRQAHRKEIDLDEGFGYFFVTSSSKQKKVDTPQVVTIQPKLKKRADATNRYHFFTVI